MSMSVFADRAHQPSMEEVYAVLGPKLPLWESLERFIAENYRLSREFKNYGKNYGWMVQFRWSGGPLISMYPQQDDFRIQLILSDAQLQTALALPLGEPIRKAILGATHYPEGSWCYFPVETARDAEDIQQLMLIKRPAPRRR
jgi:hypothetical protein